MAKSVFISYLASTIHLKAITELNWAELREYCRGYYPAKEYYREDRAAERAEREDDIRRAIGCSTIL